MLDRTTPNLAVAAVTIVVSLLAAACSSSVVPEAAQPAKVLSPEATDSIAVVPPAAEVLGQVVGPTRLAVLVPNYEALRSGGLVPDIGVAEYGDYWRAEVAEYNATHPDSEPVDLSVVSWDPLTPESTQGACRSVIDAGATVVATTANFPEAGYRCFTDANIVVLTAGPVTDLRLTRFRGLVFSVLASRERLATQGIEALHAAGILPENVAVIGNDQEGDYQAANEAARTLTTLGYSVHQEQIPTSLGIVAIRDEAGRLVQRIEADDSEAIVFASNATVAGELSNRLRGIGLPVFFLDVDGIATLDAAERLGPLWVNTVVAAPLRPTTAAPTAFEGECQRRFRTLIRGEASAEAEGDWSARSAQRPVSNRGAALDSVEPAGDIGYHECTLVSVLGQALEQLDDDRSSKAIASQLERVGQTDVALGTPGAFSADQHWLNDQMTLLQLVNDDRCTFSDRCWVELRPGS